MIPALQMDEVRLTPARMDELQYEYGDLLRANGIPYDNKVDKREQLPNPTSPAL